MKNVKEKKFVVYKHTNLENGKVYIGITSRNPKIRWANGGGYKGQPFFWRAIQKYGWDNFKSDILFKNLIKEDALIKEIELIKFYKSNNSKFGYNISSGGDLIHLGCKHTSETKAKMSKNHADFKEDKSPCAIKIICLDTLEIFNSITGAARSLGLDNRGISNVLKNKAKSCGGFHFEYLSNYDVNKEYDLTIGDTKPKHILCIETGEIFKSIADASRCLNLDRPSISCVLTGKYITTGGLHFNYCDESGIELENKKLKSKKVQRKPFSEETKEKMRQSRLGKIMPDETKKKLSISHMNNSNSKKVICIETGEVFISMSEASRILNIPKSTITLVCQGKNKTTGGLHFKYYINGDKNEITK